MSEETMNTDQQISTPGAGAAPPTAAGSQPPAPTPNPATANPATTNPAQQGNSNDNNKPTGDDSKFGGPSKPGMAGSQNQPGVSGAPTTPATDPAAEQAKKKAGLWHTFAEALSGGPRYKTSFNANTGQVEHTRVPVSGKSLGLAIALEALTGGLAGLGAHGPNHVGQAAQLGAASGAKMKEKREETDDREKQQAQADYTRHYQVAESNMRLHNLAMTAGREDETFHAKWVKDDEAHIAYVKENDPQKIAAEHLSEQDAMNMDKYPMTEYYRKVDGFVPRVDPNTGKPLFIDMQGKVVPEDAPGAHAAYDNTYAMIHKDANFALTNEDAQPLDWVADAVKYHQLPSSYLSQKMGANAQIAGAAASGIQHRTQVLKATDADLTRFYDTLNKNKQTISSGQPPMIADDKIASMIDSTAKVYGFPPALIRALALRESGDPKTGAINPNAGSDRGAQGVMQLISARQKDYGVKDPYDPQQSIEGGVKYLRDLVEQQNAKDPQHADSPDVYREALRRYHGIGSDGNTTDQEYADWIMDKSGIGKTAADQTPTYVKPDLQKELQSTPSLANAIDKFNAMYNRTGNYEQSLQELQKTDAKAASRMALLYGGRDAMHAFDQIQQRNDESAKKDQEIAMDIKKLQAEGPIKAQQKIDEKHAEDAAEEALPKGTMSAEEARAETPVKGVRQNFLDSLPYDDAALVKQIGEGRGENISSYAVGRTAQARRIAKEVALAYPGFDMSRYKTYEQTRADFTSKKTANEIDGINVAMNHLWTMYNSATAMANVPFASEFSQGVTDLQGARTGLRTEIAKIYKGGVPDKEEAAAWEAVLDKKTAGGQQNAVRTLITLLDGKLDALAARWKRGSPPAGVPPVEIMSDEALQAYRNIYGENAVPKTLKTLQSETTNWNGEGTANNTAQSQNTGNNSAQSQGNVAPDNTIIEVNGAKQIKRGGKWVPYTQGQ